MNFTAEVDGQDLRSRERRNPTWMHRIDRIRMLVKFVFRDFFTFFIKLWVLGVRTAIWLSLVLGLSIPDWSGFNGLNKRSNVERAGTRME
jgi:hypothetical protein